MRRLLPGLVMLLILLTILASCNGNTVKSTDWSSDAPKLAAEVLSGDADADIFMLDGIIYKNAEKVDWIRKLEVKPGEAAGEIQNVYQAGEEFSNGTASLLPAGTEIYKAEPREGAVLIAVVNNREIRYYGMIEG